MKTASEAGLISCSYCHLLVKVPQQAGATCPRCDSRLHSRIPNSIVRTWALVISAWVFIFPANTYPIMTVIYLGEGQPDTILSGVERLAQAGMLPIAIIVFVASIAVPILKLIGIMLLLFVVQRGWRLDRRQCTFLYRVIEVIGAWSMLDLFMISILVTLVDLGTVANVNAGPGARAFATVVVLTMLAAMTFDPRLIWDLQKSQKETVVNKQEPIND